MSPGAVEEGSKTAQVLIDSLKSTPVILSLVIFNIVYIAMSGYVWVKIQENRNASEERWERLVENAMKWCPSTTIEKSNPEPRGMRLQSDESHPVELPPLGPLPQPDDKP